MLYLCSFVFFFFKQKTAYEMRISDWSSDVCSSDLNDLDAGIQERQLTQAALDRVGLELDVAEDFRRRRERHHRAAAGHLADDPQRLDDGSVREDDHVFLAIAPDRHLQMAGQGVDDGDADTMQAARVLVRVLIDLAAEIGRAHV